MEGLDESEALDSASDDAQKSIKVVEDMPKRKVCRSALFSTMRLLETDLKVACSELQQYLCLTGSVQKQGTRLERSHETYRLLKRKNMIVEVVRSVKIVEGLYASVV